MVKMSKESKPMSVMSKKAAKPDFRSSGWEDEDTGISQVITNAGGSILFSAIYRMNAEHVYCTRVPILHVFKKGEMRANRKTVNPKHKNN